MDEERKGAASLSEIDCKNCTTDSSVGCSTNASVTTTTSGSRTNMTQCGIESSATFAATGDDIRDEMVTALAWASCRAFKYQPSDPIHYLAHQLLRWRYGDVTERIFAPRAVNWICKNCTDAGEISSSSFCSDECEKTCVERTSENETSTSDCADCVGCVDEASTSACNFSSSHLNDGKE